MQRGLWTAVVTLLRLLLVLPSGLQQLVAGTTLNVTVDDSGADPITGNTILYVPSDRWNAVRGSCATCTAKPDPSQVHNATWHDATYNGTVLSQDEIETATFHFNGQSVLPLY